MNPSTPGAIAVALLTFSALPAGAQISPVSELASSTKGAYGLDSADLNGDGHLDMLVASRHDNKVSWFPGMGDGSFGEQQTVSQNASGANRIRAVDLDLDGDLDLVVTCAGDNTIRTFEHLGATGGAVNFADLEVVTTAVDGVIDIAHADLNGDGYPDLVSVSNDDSRVAYYRNQGNGQFAHIKVLVGSNKGVRGVDLADLNGDGLADIITVNEIDETLSWFRNLGGNQFASEGVLHNTGSGVRDVAAGDLDGDGDIDLVVAGPNSRFYKNDGLGGLSSFLLNGMNATRVELRDVDGDSDLDIVASATYPAGGFSLTTSGVEVRYNTAGAFGAPTTMQEATQTDSVDVAVGDFDEDGDLDVLSTSYSDYNAFYFTSALPTYFSNQAGTFQQQGLGIVTTEGARVVRAGDLNNDGVTDLVVAHHYDSYHSAFSWLEGLGNGQFGAPELLQAWPGPVFPLTKKLEMLVEDLDGDGNLDLLVTRHLEASAMISYGNGDGSFGALVALPGSDAPRGISAGDLNNDGLMDLVVGRSLSNPPQIRIFYQQPGGSYSVSVLANSVETGPIEVVDLNDDGRLDILFSSFGSQAYYVINTPGGFGHSIPLGPFSGKATALNAADLDHDGDVDILIAYEDGTPLQLFRNQNNTGFGFPQTPLNFGDDISDLELVDMDGDGHLDAVASRLDFPNQGSAISLCRGTGNGTFLQPIHIATPYTEATSLAVFDMDGDGDQDIAMTSTKFNMVAVLTNEYPFEDCNGNRIADSADIASGFATDFNGDGLPDSCVQPPFYADVFGVDAGLGGTQNFMLNAGPTHAGQVYMVLGSLSGTAPGVDLGIGVLPLNQDIYLNLTAFSPGSVPLVEGVGVLDGSGSAAASLSLPAGFASSLVGLTVNHAFVALSTAGGITVQFISNPVPVELF